MRIKRRLERRLVARLDAESRDADGTPVTQREAFRRQKTWAAGCSAIRLRLVLRWLAWLGSSNGHVATHGRAVQAVLRDRRRKPSPVVWFKGAEPVRAGMDPGEPLGRRAS